MLVVITASEPVASVSPSNWRALVGATFLGSSLRAAADLATLPVLLAIGRVAARRFS